MSGESDVIARHEQGDRVLSGGNDPDKLAETMERHAPEPEKTAEGPAAGAADGNGASPQVPAQQAGEKPTRGRERFADLTRQREEARAEAAAAKTEREAVARELAELKAQRTAPAAQPAAEPAKPAATAPVADQGDPEPQEADFDDWRLYNAALTRWNVREAKREDAAAAAEAKRKESAATAEQRAVESFNAWVERRNAFVASNPTKAERLSAFLGTLNAGTPIGDAIMDSDVAVADYLAENKAEYDKIAALSPVSQIRAIGRIEQTLVAPAPAARAPAWRPPAAPMQPVNGNSATTPASLNEMAAKGHDFDASGWREKRAADRARRR